MTTTKGGRWSTNTSTCAESDSESPGRAGRVRRVYKCNYGAFTVDNPRLGSGYVSRSGGQVSCVGEVSPATRPPALPSPATTYVLKPLYRPPALSHDRSQ